MEIPSSLALALQYLRSKRGLSWKKLADILSIAGPGLLRRYERGKKQLSREQLEELLGPVGFGPEEIDIFLFADSLISHETEDDALSPVALTSEERGRIDKAVLAAATLGADVLRKKPHSPKETGEGAACAGGGGEALGSPQALLAGRQTGIGSNLPGVSAVGLGGENRA